MVSPLISCLPTLSFLAYLILNEKESTKVLCYFLCLPLLAWVTIALSCISTPDHGYTSLVDYFLCPRSFTVKPKENSIIVVVGASRGLGRQIVSHFTAKGYLVIGTVRKTEDAKLLVHEFGETNVLPVFLELTNYGSINTACQEITLKLQNENKSLAAIVAVAGVTSMGPFEGIPFDQLRPLMETNVIGTMNLIHNLMPTIRSHKARIVVTGAPDIPLPQYVMKSTCNGALLGFTRALRTDLPRELGISVSLIQPAATRGGMIIHAADMILNVRKGMSASLRQIYPPGFRLLRTGNDVGFDPAWATWAFDHAVTSPRPKTRYTTTPVGTFLYWAAYLMPDRLLETLLVLGPFGPGGKEIVNDDVDKKTKES